MASRQWTKGVAWRKVAVSVCKENVYISAPCKTIPVQFSRNFRNFCSISRSPGVFHTNIQFYTAKRALGARPLLNFALSTHVEKARYFSTPTDNDGKTSTPPNVGIISSMFKEEGKEENSKAPDNVKQSNESKSEEEADEKPKESPFLRSQRYAKWMLLATFAFGTPLLIYEFGPPMKDSEGNIIPDEYSNNPTPIAYAKRTFNELTMMKKDIVEPSSPKLLPDPLQHPYHQPPYTLVIELFDVLLHPTYDQVRGWRFKKRPGIDYLLENVGPPLYEVVIFTRESGMVAYPLIDSMDPKGYIMYRLFRDAARYKSGFTMGNILQGEKPTLDPYYQKDLTYLNRDLKRVIVVDIDRRATELQPSNGVSLKPWDGSNTDTELFDLASFLHTIATNEVDDVRPVLEHYRKYDDPLAAFKLAQTRMLEEQEKMAKDLQESKVRSSSSVPGLVSSFLKSRH